MAKHYELPAFPVQPIKMCSNFNLNFAIMARLPCLQYSHKRVKTVARGKPQIFYLTVACLLPTYSSNYEKTWVWTASVETVMWSQGEKKSLCKIILQLSVSSVKVPLNSDSLPKTSENKHLDTPSFLSYIHHNETFCYRSPGFHSQSFLTGRTPVALSALSELKQKMLTNKRIHGDLLKVMRMERGKK